MEVHEMNLMRRRVNGELAPSKWDHADSPMSPDRSLMGSTAGAGPARINNSAAHRLGAVTARTRGPRLRGINRAVLEIRKNKKEK